MINRATVEPPEYRTEAELCDAFARRAEAEGWKPYPEIDGWDLVLVDASGRQVGIEAKLRANAEAIAQVCGRLYPGSRTPHAAAILLPKRARDFEYVCLQLGIAVVTPPQPWMSFPAFDGIVRWHPSFGGNLRLPEIPLQGPGGCPSPRSMSAWRHKALRLCVLLDSRGYLTSQDFKAAGIDSTRWVQSRWLRDSGERVTLPGKGGIERRHTKYVWGLKRDHAPDAGYEAERELIAALMDAPAVVLARAPGANGAHAGVSEPSGGAGVASEDAR